MPGSGLITKSAGSSQQSFVSETWDALQTFSVAFLDVTQVSLPFVPALATMALVWVTWTLAKETRRMAQASQPFVTATIEWNTWSMKHCDFVLQNTGNAPAFDIEARVTPTIRSDLRKDLEMPLQKVSILRPGQTMRSYLANSEEVGDEVRRVELKWRRKPGDKREMSVAYDHYLPTDVSRLGPDSLEAQIAQQVKNIREDWSPIAQAKRRELLRGTQLDA